MDNNWGSTLNWSTVAVPTASDGNVATFGSLSPNCTVNASARVCNAIDFTGYTNTITFTNQITVSGNVTLGAAMVFAGAAGLLVNATATLTSNGTTCPQPLTLNGTITYTIVSTWLNSGLLTCGGTTLTTTINGGNLNFSGGFTHGGSTSIIAGTTTLTCVGTGTYTNPTAGGALQLNFVINTAGTLTFSSTNNFRYGVGTLTYTAGTVVTTNMTCTFNNGLTLNTAGIQWNNVAFNTGAATFTFTSAMRVNGTLTFNPSTSQSFNGFSIDAYGSITMLQDSVMSGTTVLNILGTGTWTGSSAGSIMRLNTNINCGAGTLTFSSAQVVRFGGTGAGSNGLKYVSGTVVTTGTDLVVNSTNSVLDTAGVSWNNVTLSVTGAATVLNSVLTVAGLLTLGTGTSTTTINGSQINVSGGVTHSGSTSVIAGTATLVVTGGAFTGPSSTGKITLPVTFAASTITPTTNAPRIKDLTLSGSVTFAGSVGIDVDTLTSTVAGRTHTLVATKTYRVRTGLTLEGTSGSHTSLVSGTPSSAAIFTLDSGANQSVRYVNATDIDSSGGEMVHAFHSTLLRTVNWDHQDAPGVPRGLPSALSRLRPSPSL